MKHEKWINRAKTTVSVALILMIASALILNVASASGGQATNSGYAPGVSDNALQHNRTETTPAGQMEQVTSREINVFAYRNLTLVLNCTRNCELNVTTDPAVQPKILSLSIDPNQTMALTLNMTGVPPSGEMVMERTLNFYMGIEPNATLELNAQIRLHINQTELAQELNREVNVSRLTWMYWNRTGLEWTPVPSWVDQNNYLVCNTTHFSTWTVAEIMSESSTSPTPIPTQSSESAQDTGIPVVYIYIGVAITVLAVLVVGLAAYKKRKA